jgi:hypothetical protein
MTKESLIKQLETTCFGLDPIDPLRLLVDDVIAALAQPEQDHIPDARKMVTEQEPVALESLLGAIARGWCHEKNANKEMDSDLAMAIATEVKTLYATPPQLEERNFCQRCGKRTKDIHTCTPPQRSESSGKPSAWVGLTDEDKAILEAVHRELDRDCDEGNAPGHSHRTKGVWDEDNGKLAGKPCAWCLTWAKFTTLIKNEAAHGITGEKK